MCSTSIWLCPFSVARCCALTMASCDFSVSFFGSIIALPAQSLTFGQETRSWLVDSLVAGEPLLARS
jgi:hypothetical protein